MRKHITIKGTFLPGHTIYDPSYIQVEVLEQTHENRAFGVEGTDFVHEPVRLHGESSSIRFYPKEKWRWDHYYITPGCMFSIPADKWEPLKAAVEAYNRVFAE